MSVVYHLVALFDQSHLLVRFSMVFNGLMLNNIHNKSRKNFEIVSDGKNAVRSRSMCNTWLNAV